MCLMTFHNLRDFGNVEPDMKVLTHMQGSMALVERYDEWCGLPSSLDYLQ